MKLIDTVTNFLFSWYIHRNDTLIEALNHMANELANLQQAIADNTTATAGVKSTVDALNAKLADVIDPTAVQAAADQMTANNAALTALIQPNP